MPSLPASADRLFAAAVRVNGEDGAEMYGCIRSITVDEDLDVGTSFSIELAACRNEDGSWPYIGDEQLRVWNRVTIIAIFPTQTEIVVDGYISHLTVATDPQGTHVTAQIRGVDASYALNLEDKRRIWIGKTYEEIVEAILTENELVPRITPPEPAPPAHTVAQRGTDLQLIRELARRRGYDFFVSGATAFFRPPNLEGAPQKLIAVNFGDESNCTQISIDADGTAPTAAASEFLDEMTGEYAASNAESSGLPDLGTSPLAGLRGGAGLSQRAVVARRIGGLTQARADDYGAGVLRRGGFWLIARGQLNGLRYGRVLRVRRTVTVKGLGSTYNGVYYVRKVRHQMTDRTYTMDFELARNAIDALGSEDYTGEGAESGAPPAAGDAVDPDLAPVAESGPRVMAA
ncbi:MAG: phage late control D family protein [Betaproteobacteria bacterium]